jgi:hypothetical protein
MDLNSWDDLTLGWVAGILEGEGSFMKGSSRYPNQPRVQISTTDEDVIAKISDLTGLKYRSASGGSAYTRNPHWKKPYILTIRSGKAVLLMNKLLPLMGKRRQGQIKETLSSYDKEKAQRGRPQLIPSQVVEIRKRIGIETNASIARSLGVTPKVVSDIKSGRSYKTIGL